MAKDPNLITSEHIDTKLVEAVQAPVAGQKLAEGKDPPKAPRRSADTVAVRITKKGHGKVHDGEGGTLKWQAEIVVTGDVALALEERGFGEII